MNIEDFAQSVDGSLYPLSLNPDQRRLCLEKGFLVMYTETANRLLIDGARSDHCYVMDGDVINIDNLGILHDVQSVVQINRTPTYLNRLNNCNRIIVSLDVSDLIYDIATECNFHRFEIFNGDEPCRFGFVVDMEIK